MKEYIVVFDCDKTLIRGDSTLIFLLLLRGLFGLILDFINILPQLFKFIFETDFFTKFKEILINKAINSTTIEKRKKVLLKKLPIILERLIKPAAMERLKWHKNKGHRILIVSASLKPLIISLSNYLKVELISTECNDILKINSKEKFVLKTPNCKGEQKLIRLIDYLGYIPESNNLEVYGDSSGDKELLEASSYPHFCSFTNKPIKYKENNYESSIFIIISIFIFIFGINKLLDLDITQVADLKVAILKLLSWLPLLYFILGLSYAGRYLRWRIILNSLSIGNFNIKDFLWWFSGFSLTATPGKIGEISRVQLLNKYLGYPVKKLFPVFFIERFFDLLSVLIWISFLSPNFIFVKYQQLINSFLFIKFENLILIICMILIILILLKSKINQFFVKYWKNFKAYIPKKRPLKTIIFSTFTSIYLWGIEALILWLLVYVISPKSIALSDAIIIYFISGMLGVLSGLPGGLGVNEVTSTILLQQQGISGITALTISILRRLITIWSITALSIIISINLKRNFNSNEIRTNKN
jgi:HAD superfamily phosphoserine phosphatase-like hydrolase